jgi:hypothetical protein
MIHLDDALEPSLGFFIERIEDNWYPEMVKVVGVEKSWWREMGPIRGRKAFRPSTLLGSYRPVVAHVG